MYAVCTLPRLPLQRGEIPLGARASRPHAVPLVAAEFPGDAAASHHVGGNREGRSKESQGTIPGRSKWWKWPGLCQALCGRDARAPRRTNYSPLEGQSQKPSRRAKADAVGGTSGPGRGMDIFLL